MKMSSRRGIQSFQIQPKSKAQIVSAVLFWMNCASPSNGTLVSAEWSIVLCAQSCSCCIYHITLSNLKIITFAVIATSISDTCYTSGCYVLHGRVDFSIALSRLPGRLGYTRLRTLQLPADGRTFFKVCSTTTMATPQRLSTFTRYHLD